MKRHLMSLFNFLFLCLGINAYFIFFFLSHTPIKKEKKGSKKRKKNGSALFHNSRWCTKFKYSLSGNSLTLRQTLQRTLSLSAHGNSAHKKPIICHSELVSESYSPKTLKQSWIIASLRHVLRYTTLSLRNVFAPSGLNFVHHPTQNPQVQGDNIFFKRKCFAFSLIEVMLGLIVVSVMVAAFAPVITKKISNTTVALSQADVVAGKRIKYKIFNYDPAKNGVDGCTIVGSYLQCPFEVPEEVDKIGVVLIGGGGGGAGSLSNQSTPDNRTAYNNGQQSIPITKFMQNVKVNIVAAGGGGGGGYWYYNHVHTDAAVIRPTSQAQCTSVASGSTYKNNLCISPRLNLSDIKVPTVIKELEANKTYSTYQGSTKVCWTKGDTGYSTLYKSCATPGECTTELEYGKNPIHVDVCSFDAASDICTFYGYNTSYYGKWRLPNNKNETHINWSVYDQTKDGSNDAPMSKKCHFGPVPKYTASAAGYDSCNEGMVCKADGWEWNGTQTCSDKEIYYRNPCIPSTVWIASTVSVNWETVGTYFRDSNAKCKGDWTNTSWRTGYIYAFDEENKKMMAAAVQCVLDDLGTTPASDTYTYNHSSGGGGASGGMLSDVTIPQSVIAANIGGRIVLNYGIGGAGGSASANGTTAGAGAQGGESYVIVYNSAGAARWGLTIHGGRGGAAASYNSSANGGTSIGGYYYHNGAGWTWYTNNNGLRTAGSSTGSFTDGATGARGTYRAASGIVSGAMGGASRYYSYGAGGQGGYGNDGSAANGTAGAMGYVYMSWNNVYAGAPGGGGGGARFMKVKDIPVREGDKLYVRVGKGGNAGVSANGAPGGESAFCKTSACNSGFYYRSYGGGAGTVGVRQTATANPTPGAAGVAGGGAKAGTSTVIDTVGVAGTAGYVNPTILRGAGGLGGHGGINKYLLSLDANNYSVVSSSCGGYNGTNSKASTYRCSNGSVPNASYVGDIFANPGKIYRDDSIKFGSAGSGGAGGGVDPSTNTSGTATPGQNGYVYLWWEEYD